MEAVIHVFQKLQEGWGVKLALSCIVSIAAEEHAQIFAAFVFLVCLDLVTKWLSLSRRCLIDHGTEQPGFWQSFMGLRRARRLGYIRSEEMRKRFVHKILSYIGVVLAAVVLDFMLAHAHAPAFATSLVIGYLAITEFISILENMQDSGVEEAGAIAELARRKGGITKAGRAPQRKEKNNMERVPVVDTYLDIDCDNLRTRGVTDKIVIHHTGNPSDDDLSAAEIDASHKGQGWTCIGYHYVIRKDGTVEEGRPHWTVGAHAYGENSHTIGIHVCGNFEEAEPTDAQIESLAMLLANLCTDYGLPIDRDHIVGHRELMETACPGRNLYEMMDTIVGKANFYAAQ